MSMPLAGLAKRSKTAIIAYKIYDNWRVKRHAARGVAETINGATHSRKTLAESLSYINVQFDDYLRYSGLTPQRLRGLRVLELGFGDNVGVALKFLAAGASRVVCLDKFYAKRDAQQQREIYRALRQTLVGEERQRFDEAINLSEGIELNLDKLKCIYGVGVEQAQEAGPFDLVISRAVIQEIYGTDSAFEAMDTLLAPGGYALHKIDLSDMGMFRNQGMNPLTFLTIPEFVYRLMAVDSGKPNRKLRGYYQQKMIELGYDAKLLITSVVGLGGKGDMHPHKEQIRKGEDYQQSAIDLVNVIRPSLIPAYRRLPDEELIVDGIFLVARKSRNGDSDRAKKFEGGNR